MGAALRHGVNRTAMSLFGAAFPYGTLIVNLLGAFFMGMVAHFLLGRGGASDNWRLFFVTGLLGGFTTFSAFTFEVGMMWQRSEYSWLSLYVLGSVLLSVAMLFVGMFAARAIT